MAAFDVRTLQLETERLILRPPRLEDFNAWARFLEDEEATRYIGGVQNRGLAWRTFMCMCGCWHMTGIAMFSVIEKATGKWVGRLGPWFPEGWPGEEVGWGIAREHWGKGFATEGAIAAMDFAFYVLGWPEVIHCIHVDNQASQGVARRLGSRNLGRARMPAPFQDLPIEAWGQTRAEWRERASAPKG